MAERIKVLNLKEFGRKLIDSDSNIAGVKLVVFYEDGDLAEYSSKRDKELPSKYQVG